MATNAKNLAELLNTDTTVKVGDIEDGSVTTAKLAASAVTTAKVADNAVTSAKLYASNVGRRNMIINGDMRIAQRGTSGTPIDSLVSVDRFRGRTYGGSGRFTMAQVSGGDGGVNVPNGEFPYACKLTVTTPAASEDAYDYSIAQYIEADTFAKLGWGRNEAGETLKKCTISFHMKTSVAGVYSVSLRSNGAGRSIVKETPSISANTWTKVALTFDGASNTSWRALGSGTGALFEINLGKSNAKATSTLNTDQAGNFVASTNQVRWIATNGATFFITGVQIEEGDTATDFEHLPYQESLAMCQRYYTTSYDQGHYPGQSTSQGAIFSRYASNVSNQPQSVQFPVSMRGAPTVTIYSLVGTSGHISNCTTGYSHASDDAIGISGTIGFKGWAKLNSVTVTAGNIIAYHYTAEAE